MKVVLLYSLIYVLACQEWCRKEWQCAREGNVDIIVLVDIDKFPSRQLIKSYVEAGYQWLFENQGTTLHTHVTPWFIWLSHFYSSVINYSSSHRKACYGMIAQAIQAVVELVVLPSCSIDR